MSEEEAASELLDINDQSLPTKPPEDMAMGHDGRTVISSLTPKLTARTKKELQYRPLGQLINKPLCGLIPGGAAGRQVMKWVWINVF